MGALRRKMRGRSRSGSPSSYPRLVQTTTRPVGPAPRQPSRGGRTVAAVAVAGLVVAVMGVPSGIFDYLAAREKYAAERERRVTIQLETGSAERIAHLQLERARIELKTARLRQRSR